MSEESKPREHVMYVPAIMNGEKIHGYDTMDECFEKHGSGMLVAHHEIFDDFEALQTENAKLLSALKEAVGALEFYAKGAGIEIVDEGINFSSDLKAYENDYYAKYNMQQPVPLDRPVGEKARETLAKLKAQVPGVGE